MLLKISVIQKPVTKYIITGIENPVKAFKKSFLDELAMIGYNEKQGGEFYDSLY